jgi:4-diphosphocytidyl-2-C-methyl-D-erythritol kinase
LISFPNCKINLGLQVLRKRPDGFHDIETVLYPCGLCDILEIIPSPDGEMSFSVSGREGVPGGEENLCMKAYRQLAAVHRLPTIHLHLHKNIPVGAGLGGGSSDAAFTLRMLNALFHLYLPDEKLKEYAARLGSDCPFFICNKPSLAAGRGEVFSAVHPDLSGMGIMIVKPSVSVSTAEAYSWVAPLPERPPLSGLIRRPVAEWKDCLVNDFEGPVYERYPEIKDIRERLYRQGACYAAMSGSGSAVFGLFDDTPPADREFPGCFTWKDRL